MREAVRRGTIFDPVIQPWLSPAQRRFFQSTTEADVLTVPPGEQPSVLASLSFHALHYLDLRILLLLRNLHAAGVKITLLLRDQQTEGKAEKQLPPQEGRARLLDVVELLGVPLDDVRVVNWSEVGSRMMNDPEYHRYLAHIDAGALGQSLQGEDVHFTDLDDVLASLSDVFLAGHPRYLKSTWLLGGPSRLQLHRRGHDAYLAALGGPTPRSIPLPPMPFIPELPGIVPASANKQTLAKRCQQLSKEELHLLHAGFFSLIEEALGEPLHARARVHDLEQLRPVELQAVTTDAFAESLTKLQAHSRRRRLVDVLAVPPARTLDCLAALGDERRALIFETLARSDGGFEVRELMEQMRFGREQLASVRRDLARLKKAGLVVTRGVKPQRWAAAARQIELRLPRS